MDGTASIEDVLALTLDALRDVEARMRPVFGQKRQAIRGRGVRRRCWASPVECRYAA